MINLEEKQGTLFTIGDFASKAGVTQRTIRFYDNIGLLKPCSHSPSGHRLYSRQDFAKLQKILTLKFIGLSLDDIIRVMKSDINDDNFKNSLEIQRDIIEKKILHMSMVMSTIDETLQMVNNDNVLDWNKFVNIINAINIDKNWMEQYENASNLKSRINIHELYSTNKYGWMRWYFEQLDIPDNVSILEIGCGDGSLWAKNIDRIPKGWDLTLTDFSQGMLKDARKTLEGSSPKFKFKVVDAQSITFNDSSFDVVIANHMLYHVPDIDKAFYEISRVLKIGGYFYASTVGKKHMVEMRDIVQEFAKEAVNSRTWNHTDRFQLENGGEQISKWFEDVELKRYEDSLIITDSAPLIDYILSKPGNLKEIFIGEKLNQFECYLKSQIEKEGGILITKDTGFFLGRKYIKKCK